MAVLHALTHNVDSFELQGFIKSIKFKKTS
jgi:hypothetical protein